MINIHFRHTRIRPCPLTPEYIDDVRQWSIGDDFDLKNPISNITRIVVWGEELALINRLVQGIPMIDLTLYTEMAWFGDIAKSIIWAIGLYVERSQINGKNQGWS